MARNGSGTYNLLTNSWNPAVNGVSATAADWQSLINDVAAAITQSVSADGQTPITGSLNMNGNRLTGLAAGTATGQSVRWEQLFDQGVEADIASAATVDIGAQNTNFLRITGTTTITSFGTNYRGPRFVRFAGALTLTHNATTLILPTAANITTAAGDRAIIVPVGNPGTGWQVLAYQRADGRALSGAASGDVTASGLTMNTGRLLGRTTAAVGAVEELTSAQAQSFLPIGQTRADVASAATVDLTTAVPSNSHINITGTTTITAFTIAVGRTVFVRFNASLTLTNNANIVTQTGANIVTQAGDTCTLRATAANVVEVLSYVPAVLNQQTTRSMVRVNTANGHGSTNTVIRRFTTVVTNQGSDITYADSATLGATWTINTAGVYGISYTDFFNTSSAFGVSLNSSQLTTAINLINAADRLVETNNAGSANQRYTVATTIFLPAGSVIRAHTEGFTGGGANTQFTITRIA